MGKECSVSALELDRKIWSFVNDMLEEKAYIEGEFMASIPEDKKEQALAQLRDMQFIGSAFDGDGWSLLLISSLERALNFTVTISDDPPQAQVDTKQLKKTQNIIRAFNSWV